MCRQIVHRGTSLEWREAPHQRLGAVQATRMYAVEVNVALRFDIRKTRHR